MLPATANAGCGGVSGGFGVTLDADYLDVLHDGTALDDGTLDANDIANAVAFLASEEASYITGTILHVNGGMY